MTIQHDVHPSVVQHGLQVGLHDIPLALVASIAVVPWAMHHHDNPRGLRAIDSLQVLQEPVVLQASSLRSCVTVERYDVHGPNVPTPVQTVGGATGVAGHRPSEVVRHPGLAAGDLVVATASHDGHRGPQTLYHPAKRVPTVVVSIGVAQIPGQQHHVRRHIHEGLGAEVGNISLPNVRGEAHRERPLPDRRHGEGENPTVSLYAIMILRSRFEVR
mmetsp:Transcript_75299/g.126722  ORF Transcript_75299/g.126722 Transcript_75299/m.126722 type:complete len:216 (+) Transcript_75299:550-1197(+)